MTRNVTRSVAFFHESHFTLPPFVPALSREFTPYKVRAGASKLTAGWGPGR